MNIYSIKPAIITNVSLIMADHGTFTVGKSFDKKKGNQHVT